ncbi:haloacid dehalogenase superfamily, subfamily IA, variant 3 with third motif having DD or ED [Arenibacter palladensis]|uniref:Haloacid dehalogenase superfamily, subfamily IA, variant 3 with third motif having DD or ED n=1 Tax=Arenibacter palladensis TaxID=237373 RepID=A0A1M5F3H2_9FLAO|nr:HAD family phosphatase [Arenibacter palladensis]MDO6605608.1 HAD family phosphatase [Arenibacter palladensis]SHF86109.1 haloacid dehalogenase superfamily, subfamily IA, variant 3 with third motif having DD or ED [Arenibacter palladensis]
MIRAIIFDLDGTLVHTEILKAESYAQAIQILTKGSVSQKMVLDSFGKYVGLSRAGVVNGLFEEYKKPLSEHLDGLDSEAVQERIITSRIAIYHQMLNDKTLLSSHFCKYNMELLRSVHKDNFKTVVATMSHRFEADMVIEAMGIRGKLDIILTSVDILQGKPHPEIYLKVKEMLKMEPEECLVIEDSLHGIKAGLAAGMNVFAVTNPLTRSEVHAANVLAPSFIIDDPKELIHRVYQFIKESR